MNIFFRRCLALLAASFNLCAAQAHEQPAAPDRQEQTGSETNRGAPALSAVEIASAAGTAADAARQDTDPQLNGSIKDAIPGDGDSYQK